MDPRKNPYAPGAGTPPPELAGRDALMEKAAVALDRIRSRLAARSVILYGLRGVGKTVLLNRIRLDAESRGLFSVTMEAPETRSLPALLAPAMRATLLRLSHSEAAKDLALRALRGLKGFVSALKVRYSDIEVAIDGKTEEGLADSGDLDTDLSDLLRSVGEAAAARETAVVIYIDELQYIKEDELAALITAIHNANQSQLPITMVAAGLPQLLGQMGRAKSYAERLFEFIPIGSLDEEQAKAALCVPAERAGVAYEPSAMDVILERTRGYPYFLQEWGKHCWDVAAKSPIREADAQTASTNAIAELDASFFRVRFDRLTPAEKAYLRAMASLGDEGPHRSGDIATALKREVQSVAPIRSSLIAKGMIYSPSFGDNAFTVPLFGGFMRRIIGGSHAIPSG